MAKPTTKTNTGGITGNKYSLVIPDTQLSGLDTQKASATIKSTNIFHVFQ